MGTIRIAIAVRCGDSPELATDVLKPMLVPYLRNLAGESRIVATSVHRKLNGKDAGKRSAVLELDLEDATEVEPETIASMLEKFLKHVTEDAGAAGTFDIFKVESSREPPERAEIHGSS
jgi:hypothetical protein